MALPRRSPPGRGASVGLFGLDQPARHAQPARRGDVGVHDGQLDLPDLHGGRGVAVAPALGIHLPQLVPRRPSPCDGRHGATDTPQVAKAGAVSRGCRRRERAATDGAGRSRRAGPLVSGRVHAAVPAGPHHNARIFARRPRGGGRGTRRRPVRFRGCRALQRHAVVVGRRYPCRARPWWDHLRGQAGWERADSTHCRIVAPVVPDERRDRLLGGRPHPLDPSRWVGRSRPGAGGLPPNVVARWQPPDFLEVHRHP
jgi:hypothetical protein